MNRLLGLALTGTVRERGSEWTADLPTNHTHCVHQQKQHPESILAAQLLQALVNILGVKTVVANTGGVGQRSVRGHHGNSLGLGT